MIFKVTRDNSITVFNKDIKELFDSLIDVDKIINKTAGSIDIVDKKAVDTFNSLNKKKENPVLTYEDLGKQYVEESFRMNLDTAPYTWELYEQEHEAVEKIITGRKDAAKLLNTLNIQEKDWAYDAAFQLRNLSVDDLTYALDNSDLNSSQKNAIKNAIDVRNKYTEQLNSELAVDIAESEIDVIKEADNHIQKYVESRTQIIPHNIEFNEDDYDDAISDMLEATVEGYEYAEQALQECEREILERNWLDIGGTGDSSTTINNLVTEQEDSFDRLSELQKKNGLKEYTEDEIWEHFSQLAKAKQEFTDEEIQLQLLLSDSNEQFISSEKELAKNITESNQQILNSNNEISKNLKPIDIDSMFPKLSDDDFNDLLTKYVELDKAGANWQEEFKTMKEWQIKFVQDNDLSKASLEDLQKAYVDARQAAIDHNKSIKEGTLSYKAGQAALTALSMAAEMAVSAFASWAISQIISGLAKLVDYINVTTEELNGLTDAFKNSQSELQDLEKEFEETQVRLEELQSIESPTLIEQDEISKLQETNALLEDQIILLREKQRIAARELLEEANKATTSYKYSNFANGKNDPGIYDEGSIDTPAEVLQDYTNKIIEARKEINELKQAEIEADKNIDAAEEKGNPGDIKLFEKIKQKVLKKQEKAEKNEEDLIAESMTEYERLQSIVGAYQAIYDAGGDLTEEEMAHFISCKEAAGNYLKTIEELQEERKKLFSEKSVEEKRTSIDTYMQLGGIEDEETRKELLASISDKELDIVAGLHFDSSMTVESLREAINKAKGIVAENGEIGEIEVPLTVSQSVNQVAQQLKPQFDALGEAYKAIFYTDEGFSHKNVDTEMLQNLRSAFQDISEEAKEMGLSAIPTDQLDNFLDTLADVNVEQEDTQQAFNDIATTWLYSTGVIDDLNDATATSVEKMLDEMGVTNANEVVTLNLAAAKEYAAEKGEDLADASASDIAAFAAERIQANALSVDLIKVYLGKIRANMAQIESKDDIDNLIAIAKAAGATSESLAKLEAIKNSVNGEGTTAMQRLQLRQTVDSDENLDVGLNVDIEDFMPNKDDAGSAGKDAADAYVESFEKELKTLEALKDQGKITEKEYLDYLRQLYERYFKDREEYLDKYKEYEDKYLRGKIYAPFYSNVDYKK